MKICAVGNWNMNNWHMNNFFPFLLLYLNTAPTEKDYCRSRRSPTTAEFITAVITGRGNLEVYAVQPRRGVWPRRGVFFEEVGRPRVSSFLLFFLLFLFLFSVVVGKIEVRDRDPCVARSERKVTVEESAARKSARAAAGEKRPFSKG